MARTVKEFLTRPEWPRQIRWRRAIWNTMARVGLTGVHALPLHKRWVEMHRRPMPLVGLDKSLEGMILVQISDLHYSPVVWGRYLRQFVHWINDLEPGLVVVTGDLITGGYGFAQRVATLLAHVRATHGVIATFGNHDYGMYGKTARAEGGRRADHLEKCLSGRGVQVLRNGVAQVRPRGAEVPLLIVGLDDEWSGHMDAPRAFAGVNPNHPIICLNHNPANCPQLMAYPWQWMLCGHTHGRQIAAGRLGQRFYPHRHRRYTHGYYAVSGRHLYVNRGLSYGQRVEHWCRPEITVFALQRA